MQAVTEGNGTLRRQHRKTMSSSQSSTQVGQRELLSTSHPIFQIPRNTEQPRVSKRTQRTKFRDGKSTSKGFSDPGKAALKLWAVLNWHPSSVQVGETAKPGVEETVELESTMRAKSLSSS